MATIIHFKKEEKLAIIKIMIDLSNHYYKGATFVQEVAAYFDISNEMPEAYHMSLSEAQNILETGLKYESSKQRFVCELLNYLLRDDKFKTDGVFKAHCRYAKSITSNFINYDFSVNARNPMPDYVSIDSSKSKKKSNTIPSNIENIDLESLKEELRKELKEFVRKEISEELRKGIKNIMHNNLNETLYKDL